jgi:outer membrane protein insertion porin family
MNVVGANISGFGGKDVPFNERFIMGGLFTLRGYDYLTIGPKANLSPVGSPTLSTDAVTNNLGGQQIVIGGHNQLLMNTEIEFPLLTEAKIRGVIFFDAGNAFDGWFNNVSPAFMANVGWGVRWFTPIGPLRFEFGYPIVNSGSPKFYFTIGPPF